VRCSVIPVEIYWPEILIGDDPARTIAISHSAGDEVRDILSVAAATGAFKGDVPRGSGCAVTAVNARTGSSVPARCANLARARPGPARAALTMDEGLRAKGGRASREAPKSQASNGAGQLMMAHTNDGACEQVHMVSQMNFVGVKS